jgi:hypothetical protein
MLRKISLVLGLLAALMPPAETFAKHGDGHGHGGHARKLHAGGHGHAGHWHGRSVHRHGLHLAWQLAWTGPSALVARSMVGLWCWPLLASGSWRLGMGLLLMARRARLTGADGLCASIGTCLGASALI